MLGFSQRDPGNQQLNELSFKPIVISNQPHSLLGLPKNSQKKITKTISTSKPGHTNQDPRKASAKNFRPRTSSHEQKEGWIDHGKIQIFDRSLRKNALAEEERRLRAQVKKERNQAVREITKKEKDIRGKTVQLERQQEKQIEELKQLIQKEQEEKMRNERAYQQRLKQIEKERNDLIKLQRKIQEHGVKHQKEYAQQMVVLRKNEYPTNDRSKCHQELRMPQQPGPQYEASHIEANQQRQAFRQKQLQTLVKHREKCMTSQASLNYNPVVVPLLSRASYKIISTHVSSLVQLLVDDMLEQQVYLLEEIELKENARLQKEKQKNMIQDYYSALEDFVDEAENIERKVGQYKTMHFEDLYIPKHYPKPPPRQQEETYQGLCELKGHDPDAVEEILDRRDRFLRFVGNFDEYKKGHLTMFEKVTEELVDETIWKLAQELDRGSNDFVELMFRKEFQ